jgi:hypothetical protein
VTAWNDTPAGLIRNQGWYADDVALAKAREFNSVERRAARMAFDAAWGDPGNWGTDTEGRPVNPRAIQEELAARGWTGAWIDVPNTIPPALRPLHAQSELSKTRQATNAAGRKDAEWQRLEAELRARYEAARARMDARLGPLAGTVDFGGP